MNRFVFAAFVTVENPLGRYVNMETLAVAMEHDPETYEQALALFGIDRIPCGAVNVKVVEDCESEDDFRWVFREDICNKWEEAGGEWPEMEQSDDNSGRIRKDDPAGSKGSHKSTSRNSRKAGHGSDAASVQRMDKKNRHRKP